MELLKIKSTARLVDVAGKLLIRSPRFDSVIRQLFKSKAGFCGIGPDFCNDCQNTGGCAPK